MNSTATTTIHKVLQGQQRSIEVKCVSWSTSTARCRDESLQAYQTVEMRRKRKSTPDLDVMLTYCLDKLIKDCYRIMANYLYGYMVVIASLAMLIIP